MASTGCLFLATDVVEVDARGLKCPLPVLKLEKQLAQAQAGTIVVVLTTDPMAKVDIPLHCRQHGHAYAQDEAEGVVRFTVTKSGAD